MKKNTHAMLKNRKNYPYIRQSFKMIKLSLREKVKKKLKMQNKTYKNAFGYTQGTLPDEGFLVMLHNGSKVGKLIC
jgi:hypothetical protein